MKLDIASQLIQNSLFMNGSYFDHFDRKTVEFDELRLEVLSHRGTTILCPEEINKLGAFYMDEKGLVHLAVVDLRRAKVVDTITLTSMNSLYSAA